MTPDSSRAQQAATHSAPDPHGPGAIVSESTKHVWVLPLEGQTAETGTLAQFLSSLGLRVAEQDLDAESDVERDA